MEVMEEGNLMDRVPILVDRDLEYYQKNQTVLSEKICLGVVGGRLDFPKNASFASVKLVLWWEEEFYAAFRTNSSLFSASKKDEKSGALVKSSDPDKFFVMIAKSSELLLEHLHVLAQEALDHADLSVLTATLGASAIIQNSLHCYIQSSQHITCDKVQFLQQSFRNFEAMSEAVGERLLDLHVRLLSLYLLQEAGGRALDTDVPPENGSPSIQGWWLYMQGTKQDLWDTVPPKMAGRIFAGMLNNSLTILTVRYCQTRTTKNTTELMVNDILNILQCVSKSLAAICNSASELLGLNVTSLPREVRDVHSKCGELLQCLVYRGAPLHYLQRVFKNNASIANKATIPAPWFTFVNPKIFPSDCQDVEVNAASQLSKNVAIGLELIVLLAKPQPSWTLLVKVLLMRKHHLLSHLLSLATNRMSKENMEWPSDGKWLTLTGQTKCDSFLCTNDGFCAVASACKDVDEHSRVAGALTYILIMNGTRDFIKSILINALESSGNTEWASCLDRRQVWCSKRPAWLAAMLAFVPKEFLSATTLTLIKAYKTGATMYQAMSLCINCLIKSWEQFPRCLLDTANSLQDALPVNIVPTGGSVLLQIILSALYEEFQTMIKKIKKDTSKKPEEINELSMLIALGEALCSIDEDNKHTDLIAIFLKKANSAFVLSDDYNNEEFSDIFGFIEDPNLPLNVERCADAELLSNQLLITDAGKDSLRVVYEHIKQHDEEILTYLCMNDFGYSENDERIALEKAPLLYTMFHIGRRPFDLYLNVNWKINWSYIVDIVKDYYGTPSAKQHVLKRWEFNDNQHICKTTAHALQEIRSCFTRHKE